MNTATHYNLRYRGVVNDLLKLMAEGKDYSGVYDYATEALNIDPENLTAHYWLIYALYYTGSIELAKAEVQRAKMVLDEEEYRALIHKLKRLKGRSPFDFLGSKLFSVF